MSESVRRGTGPDPVGRFAVQSLLSDEQSGWLDGQRREVLDRLVAARDAQAQAEVAQLDAVVELCSLYRTTDLDEFSAVASSRVLRLAGDGTPRLSEFVVCEVAAALGMSQLSAVARIVEALNLKFRHPVLYAAVRSGRVRLWQASKVVAETTAAGLDLARAQWVDRQLAPHLGRITVGRLVALARGLAAEADPQMAAERAERARERRHVSVVTDAAHTVGEVTASLDLVDAVVLNHTLALLADGFDGSDSLDVRRAKALGLLATPGRALLALRSCPDYHDDIQTGLDREVELSGSPGSAVGMGRPRTALVVHCTPESLADGNGISRIDGLGPVVTSQLRSLLADSMVTVRPVVDHNAAPAVDRYEIPAATRAAVLNRTGFDAFPFGSLPAERCDLDHVTPYADPVPAGSPPQTRVDNLAPLSRRAHRAKTHGGWRYLLDRQGYHLWRSPLRKYYLTGPDGTTSHDSALELCLQLLLERSRWGPPTAHLA